MKIRNYNKSDLPVILKLFYDTVHIVNIKDYDMQQVNAWAPKKIDEAAWDRSLSSSFCLVASIDKKIVGFGNIYEDGYLDRLYVHHAYQRQGIGNMLCDELEKHCQKKIYVHASTTALPFFKMRGYKIVKKQEVFRRGCFMINWLMEKD